MNRILAILYARRLLLFTNWPFIGLANQGKDIVLRFIIEYSSSLWDFGPLGNNNNNNNRSIFII
jgi:hypothetical protein